MRLVPDTSSIAPTYARTQQLHNDMNTILGDNLGDDIKLRLYQDTFLKNKGLVSQKKKQESDDIIIREFDGSSMTFAHDILEILKRNHNFAYDNRNRLIYKLNVIPYSNVSGLIKDMIIPTISYFPKAGTAEMIKIMEEIDFPIDLIINKAFLAEGKLLPSQFNIPPSRRRIPKRERKLSDSLSPSSSPRRTPYFPTTPHLPSTSYLPSTSHFPKAERITPKDPGNLPLPDSPDESIDFDDLFETPSAQERQSDPGFVRLEDFMPPPPTQKKRRHPDHASPAKTRSKITHQRGKGWLKLEDF